MKSLFFILFTANALCYSEERVRNFFIPMKEPYQKDVQSKEQKPMTEFKEQVINQVT